MASSSSTASETPSIPEVQAARPDDPDATDSLRPWLQRVLVSMTVFALLATALRIHSRRLNRQRLGWDDWLAVISMVRIRIVPDSCVEAPSKKHCA